MVTLWRTSARLWRSKRRRVDISDRSSTRISSMPSSRITDAEDRSSSCWMAAPIDLSTMHSPCDSSDHFTEPRFWVALPNWPHAFRRVEVTVRRSTSPSCIGSWTVCATTSRTDCAAGCRQTKSAERCVIWRSPTGYRRSASTSSTGGKSAPAPDSTCRSISTRPTPAKVYWGARDHHSRFQLPLSSPRHPFGPPHAACRVVGAILIRSIWNEMPSAWSHSSGPIRPRDARVFSPPSRSPALSGTPSIKRARTIGSSPAWPNRPLDRR